MATSTERFQERIQRGLAANQLVERTVTEQILRGRENRPKKTIEQYEPKAAEYEVFNFHPPLNSSMFELMLIFMVFS